MCVITLIEFRGITGLGGTPFPGPGIPPFLRVRGTITGCPPPPAGGTVTVQFSAALSPMGCSGGPFEWKVTNLSTGVVLQPFTAGGSTFSYVFSVAANYKVNVRVQQAETCEDPVLTDSVTFPIV